MNKLALLQFGDMIQNTAARNALYKLAQLHPGQRAGLGALFGAMGGGLLGNRVGANVGDGNEYSGTGTLAGMLGGGLAGYNMAAPAGYTPFSRMAYSATRAMPNALAGLGAVGGGIAGWNAPGALGQDDDSWQTKALGGLAGAGVGMGLGHMANTGIQNAAAQHYMAGQVDRHGAALANAWHNGGAAAGGIRADISANDPNRLIAHSLVGEAGQNLLQPGNRALLDHMVGSNTADARAVLENATTLRGAAPGNLRTLTNAHGIDTPSQRSPVDNWLRQNLGQNYREVAGNYGRPLMMAGAGLAGAHALGSAYQGYRDVVDYDPNAKNKKPQLTLGLG